ncbi:MAG: hypothetical protein Q4D29_13560 [Lachnospiraceae bacterium]|nr:hypothetical protein [Lachnospiraceae bacterium]
MIFIFVDDERKSPFTNETFPIKGTTVLTCRTYNSAINTIQHCVEQNVPFMLDLDHDLGEEKTGYDICKYLVENEISPIKVVLHTQNVVGRMNMRQLLNRYGYNVGEY